MYILCEPTVTYNYGQSKIPQYHDKTFKELFSNKKEAVKFINKYLLKGTENNLEENQIEKQNTEFITKQKEQLETDILYKIKDTNIFILIEQQSKVDYFMAKRILYYYIEIMHEIEKETKDKIVPIIYPIVLHTGKTKWTAKIKLEELQEGILGIEKALNLSYHLVDINNYTKEELRKERSSIAKAMLMEKIKNREELIEELEKKVVDTMVMENLRDIFRMNYNEGVENGIQTATHNFIIQMLKNNISEETIKKITKVKKEELQRLKKEIKN